MQDSGQLLSDAAVSAQVAVRDSVRRARVALFWAVLISLILLVLPHAVPALAWLAWPQALTAALAHEMGHGLTALLSGGTFESLRLYADGSGVAFTRTSSTSLVRAGVAAGGLFGPPVLGAVLFGSARHARLARVALILLSLLLALALVCWVRNMFGATWVGFCTLFVGWVAWRWSAVGAQAFTAFLAVQACLSSLARTDYLFSSKAHTGAGEFISDSAQIAAQLGGPHWLWGALVFLLSIVVMVTGLWWFLRAVR